MANIFRQRVVWSGFPGGPGLSTFYFSEFPVPQFALHDLFVSLATFLPADVTLTLQPGGDVIESSTGTLTGSWAGEVTAPVVGTQTGVYSAPTGFMVRWETATVRDGSRLRGRTYFVPSGTTAYQADGSIAAQAIVDLSAAASTFVGAVTPALLVWQRPRAARSAFTDGKGIAHKAVQARTGSTAPVIGSSVPDLAVVMRSRRD